MRFEFVSNIVALVAEVLLSLLLSAGTARLHGLLGPERKGNKDRRIKHLTSSLSEATSLIKQIELEIESKKAEVLKLQTNIEIYNKVLLLKQSDVAAVINLLRHELSRERKWSFCENAILHFVFFVLGIVMGLILIH